MEPLKRGRQSFILKNKPVICSWASVAGKKELEGPLGSKFDLTETDSYFGEKTWEQAEKRMQQLSLEKLTEKLKIGYHEIDLVCSGDLLNQCISSSFTLRNSGVPHLGLYGACSTMAEGLLLAGLMVDGGYVNNAVAISSSHFAASERQYRFPLAYGGQRPPTAQWTVTGAGAVYVSCVGKGPRIDACTIGTVTDLGITDANNMGPAMAPAALETIKAHFQDLKITANDYDLIITGDLGQLGKDALLSLAQKDGLSLGHKLLDCGTIIYDQIKQDVHCGGSGCGCSGVVLCADLFEKLKKGKLKRILFCGTGALLSPTSVQQGLPIPGTCHAVSIIGG